MTPPSNRKVVQAASIVTGEPIEKICAPSRVKHYVRIRAAIVCIVRGWRCRGERFSTSQLAKVLGGRDHSSLCNAWNRREAYARDPEWRAMVRAIRIMALLGLGEDSPIEALKAEEAERDRLKKVRAEAFKRTMERRKLTDDMWKAINCKPKNDFRTTNEPDSSHAGMEGIAKGSARLLTALNAARVA